MSLKITAIANHEPAATELTDASHARYRVALEEVISAMAPRPGGLKLRRPALFLSALLEGHTVFVGHGKPSRGEIDALADLALAAFVPLIENDGSWVKIGAPPDVAVGLTP